MFSAFDALFEVVGVGFLFAIGFRGFETLVYIIQSSAAWLLSRFKKDR